MALALVSDIVSALYDLDLDTFGFLQFELGVARGEKSGFKGRGELFDARLTYIYR